MFETILNKKEKEELVGRINSISTSSHRQWGTMNVEEMLWHLRSQLELALGILPQTTNVKSMLALPPLRWMALYIFKWSKGLPTAREMNVKKSTPDVKDIYTEKKLLLQRLSEIENANELYPHPLFRKMSKKDWGRLIWKHIDHHLRQFGS
jgi:hypothetical protein